MVDKPGRRKKKELPWKKATGLVVVAILLVASGWYIYQNYIYKAPPVYARFDTSDGSFYVELFPACAPQTVANFVKLAQSGFYKDLVWHRIVKGFVIQSGDPTTKGGLNGTRAKWGTGGSNHTVPLEWCGWLHNYAGYLSMARKGGDVNSGTSQFYINLANNTSNLSLDGNYTVFGKVISGMNVVYTIAKSPLCLPPTCPKNWPAGQPLPPVFLNNIVILSGSPLTSTSSQTST